MSINNYQVNFLTFTKLKCLARFEPGPLVLKLDALASAILMFNPKEAKC